MSTAAHAASPAGSRAQQERVAPAQNSFQREKSLPTKEWEFEHKGKGTDAARDDSSSRTGSEPKGCTSWDSTMPIVPEPAHPWPGSQGCLRMLPAPPACIPAHGCIWENSISPPTGFQRAGRGIACGSKDLSWLHMYLSSQFLSLSLLGPVRRSSYYVRKCEVLNSSNHHKIYEQDSA